MKRFPPKNAGEKRGIANPWIVSLARSISRGIWIHPNGKGSWRLRTVAQYIERFTPKSECGRNCDSFFSFGGFFEKYGPLESRFFWGERKRSGALGVDTLGR
jgi:hypothetical protein